ncbi:MAG TPA: endo-1,4-beta-xylanase [Candidatus Acidoferrales bacterium]|jgi:endo-1,4-beta-xylanase|nr:endo-1,4-beta-xylanase [Candidatus Acidoferrales bacterium]
MNRRELVKMGVAVAGTAAIAPWTKFSAAEAAVDFDKTGDLIALRDVAQSRGLIFGAAIPKRNLSADSLFSRLVERQCGILVPEWELKWEALRPAPDRFDFSGGDWLYEYTQRNHMLFRGHTLVWEAALPSWFASTVNARNAKSVLAEHISTVVTHYAGKMHSWDVVNEAFQIEDGRPDGLKTTPWLRFIGPDYIEAAFHAAHEADPAAALYYNENWLEPETDACERKRRAVLTFLKGMKKKGVPIHGLGIQSHLFAEANVTGPNFRRFLDEVADLGLAIAVSELDVRDKNLPGNPETRDRLVAEQYYKYLSFVLKCKAVKTVLTWGLSDRYTWIARSQGRADGLPVRPLPYDANLEPLEARWAVQRAMEQAPAR